MSLSKTAQNCVFCKVGKGIYCCPKCNKKYCSSYCYKCREHEGCSEAFFRECVEEALKEKTSDLSDREQMMQILKKIADESVDDDSVPFDQSAIEDRFAGLNINDADETVIWHNLNDDEKAKFKAIVESGKGLETLIPVKQPWWTVTTLNLVSEFDSDESDLKDEISVRPPYPLNAKKLSDLTSAKPSECIQFNLINILYAYAFLNRFYNCDLRDFLEDVVDSFFVFSPVLSEGKNYFCMQESLQDSIRLILHSDLNVSVSFTKSIINDVENIMNGPNNAKPSTFVLCALHDIKLLMEELKYLYRGKKEVNKDLKKKLLLSVKRIEYYISWSLEYESILCEVASDLVLVMLPDLIPDPNIFEEVVHPKIKEKQLIEEVE